MRKQGARIEDMAEREDFGVCAHSTKSSQTSLLHSVLRRRPGYTGSRRHFLKGAITSLGALGFWMMDQAAKRTAAIPENRETTVTVPWDATNGIHFHDQVIVVNSSSGVAVFSSLCPHMGCRINRTEGAELLCPCHGSRFNLQGEVVHGPALRGLRALPFALDQTRAALRVTLEK